MRRTIEMHSKDSNSYIFHKSKQKWKVVWKGEPLAECTTREIARSFMRELKRLLRK